MTRWFVASIGVVMLMLGCGSTKPADAQPAMTALTDHTWKLVRMEGLPVPADAGVTMQLTGDGKITGDTGVNRYFGTYTAGAPDFIEFSAIGMTRRAGPEDRMAREAQFAGALGRVTRYRFAPPNELTLTDGTTALLVFAR